MKRKRGKTARGHLRFQREIRLLVDSENAHRMRHDTYVDEQSARNLMRDALLREME